MNRFNKDSNTLVVQIDKATGTYKVVDFITLKVLREGIRDPLVAASYCLYNDWAGLNNFEDVLK